MFESPWALPLAGLLIGTIMGLVARWNHFCTLSALERYWYGADADGLRTWVLAGAVALLSTQTLIALGVIDLRESFYLDASFLLPGAVLGGFLFGLGMALVGTCGFGALVRLGGGSLRSLIIVITIGLAALTAQRGLIGRVRETYFEPLSFDFSQAGTQSLSDIVESITGFSLQLALALLVGISLLYWVFLSASYRSNVRSILTGTVIGLCVTAGWLTTYHLSHVLFRQVQIESASFVMPPGELILGFIAVTGTIPDYGIGLVVGVVFGSGMAACFTKDVHWEACDDARELSRHLSGACLMGVGGVLATGCTVGQGISALSTMAVSAPIVFVSICLGARLGLRYLIEGSFGVFTRST
jgi:hypothetical protein